MTKTTILLRAEREIEDIRGYIARDNPLAAEAVVARIHEAIESLTRHPRMGHETVSHGLRMFVGLFLI